VAKRALEESTYDRILLYNQAYSVNNTFLEVGKRYGIKGGFIHYGHNLKHMLNNFYISWVNVYDCLRDKIKFFYEHKDLLRLDFSQFKLITDHIGVQLKSNSVFSYSSAQSGGPNTIYSTLGISSEFKKIVLLSMSSNDETYAGDVAFMGGSYTGTSFHLFENQIQWVIDVIEHFKMLPECKLIVRVHPREFPTKRDNITSPRVQQYLEIFSNLPTNIVINYPDQKISIYDLMEIIDFQLVPQSTAGLEAARLGVPGISHIKGMGAYPIAWVCDVPETKEDYFKLIAERIKSPRINNLELIKRSFYWYTFLFTQTTVNFDSHDYWAHTESRNFFHRSKRFIRRVITQSRLNINEYLNQSELTAQNKKALLEQIELSEETYLIKFKHSPTRSDFDSYFNKYLLGLFQIHYGIDLEKVKKIQLVNGQAKKSDGAAKTTFPLEKRLGVSLLRHLHNLNLIELIE
jgi:hypothetical protein